MFHQFTYFNLIVTCTYLNYNFLHVSIKTHVGVRHKCIITSPPLEPFQPIVQYVVLKPWWLFLTNLCTYVVGPIFTALQAKFERKIIIVVPIISSY